MKSVLHLEHLRHFQRQGSIVFEALVPSKDCCALEVKLKNFLKTVAKDTQNPRWRKNVFRSIPEVSTLVRKRRLADFAAELIHRPKVSLVEDFWVFPGEQLPKSTEDCQLLLCLSGDVCGQGVFFIGTYPEQYSEQLQGSALLFIFSSSGNPVY
ncbi:DUF5070 domain-containing protein [Chlamydia avium]|uniref:Divalent cation-dependent regulator A n=1 Tax=Chlamydia avium 10DC88 TaxID=1229831 RepID=W8JZA6_9CHLA|nr:DUF5070 domain-containing protein [Chlamydia avium]AHK63022.1 Putative divalent cation-dependent regulator A [Chlamydia avium 10DC88]